MPVELWRNGRGSEVADRLVWLGLMLCLGGCFAVLRVVEPAYWVGTVAIVGTQAVLEADRSLASWTTGAS